MLVFIGNVNPAGLFLANNELVLLIDVRETVEDSVQMINMLVSSRSEKRAIQIHRDQPYSSQLAEGLSLGIYSEILFCRPA